MISESMILAIVGAWQRGRNWVYAGLLVMVGSAWTVVILRQLHVMNDGRLAVYLMFLTASVGLVPVAVGVWRICVNKPVIRAVAVIAAFALIGTFMREMFSLYA